MKMFYPFLFLLFVMPNLGIGQDLNYEIIQENVSCYGEVDGILHIAIEENPDLYPLLWSTGSTQATITDLAPGNYGLTISDAAGGILEELEFEITEPEYMYAVVGNTVIICNQPAYPNAIVFGGTGGYTYLWSNGNTEIGHQTTEPGVFSLTVTDSNGCEWSGEYSIDENFELPMVNAGEDMYLTCEDERTVELIGETNEEFFFHFVNWSTEDGTIIGSDNELSATVSPGTYYFWVRHPMTLCEATDTVTVFYDENFDYEISKTDVECYGTSSGSAELSIDEEANTSVVWSTGETEKEIENLTTGSYLAMIQYENCEKTDTFSISQPEAALEVGSSTIYNGDGSATIELNITGGWGDEAIVWYYEGEIIGEDIDTMLVDKTGNYSIIVMDAGGCEVETSTFVDLMTSNKYRSIENEIRVYPNPARNTISIDNLTSREIQDLSILNYTGNIIKEISATNDANYYIGFLPSGSYLIQIKYTDGKSQIIKLNKI